MADLDELAKARRVEDLWINERGFTVPWALERDTDGRMWIDKRFHISERPDGTYDMCVIYNGFVYLCYVNAHVTEHLETLEAHIGLDIRHVLDPECFVPVQLIDKAR